MRAAAIVVALTLGSTAGAEEPSAPTLFKRGVEALRARDYAAAATAFQESYALAPRAATVCNLALTYDRWAGHVAEAVESYRKCAEDDESGRFRDHALERARQLREQLGATRPRGDRPPEPRGDRAPEPRGDRPPEPQAERAPEPRTERAPEPRTERAPEPGSKPPPAAAVSQPAAALRSSSPSSSPSISPSPSAAVIAAPGAPLPSESRARPFFRDPAASVLTALGVAGVASGVGLAIAGKLDDNCVATTADLGQKTTLYDRAGVLSPAGYIMLGVGAALVVAGVVEWAAHGRHAVRH